MLLVAYLAYGVRLKKWLLHPFAEFRKGWIEDTSAFPKYQIQHYQARLESYVSESLCLLDNTLSLLVKSFDDSTQSDTQIWE